MSYDAKVFNVMVASPGDVLPERQVFREVIHEWNAVHSATRKIVLMPVGWETHSSPASGAEPQEIINNQVLHSCDLLVGIFWTRTGTPTTQFASGTVEEIERHIAAGRLAMLYFSSKPAVTDDIDFEQYNSLKGFKASCRQRSLYESFDSLAEFRDKFYRQLQRTLNEHEMFMISQELSSSHLKAASEAQLPQMPILSQEAKALLKEASFDGDGQISYYHYLGGSQLETNGKSFLESSDRRDKAKWEAGLFQLRDNGLVSPRGSNGENFELTARGYEVADTIEL